jgi:hypothetical protein
VDDSGRLRGIEKIWGVDEIKECLAVLSLLFIDRGELGGLDTTTAMVERWRCLESSFGLRSFSSGYART